MVGFTDRVSQGVLNHIVGKTSIFTLTTPMYVGLFTAIGTDAGTGFTEVSGGGYLRSATAAAGWNAASGSSPSTITNASAITFPTSTAAWSASAPIIAFGLFDASSTGNLLAWDFLGNNSWMPFSASLASPSVLTAPAHGFAATNQVVVTAEFGGVLPTGGVFSGLLTVAAAPATDSFNVGINATASGSGMVRQVVALVVGSTGITPSLGAGSCILVSS